MAKCLIKAEECTSTGIAVGQDYNKAKNTFASNVLVQGLETVGI